jgi:hypothetical protein
MSGGKSVQYPKYLKDTTLPEVKKVEPEKEPTGRNQKLEAPEWKENKEGNEEG